VAPIVVNITSFCSWKDDSFLLINYGWEEITSFLINIDRVNSVIASRVENLKSKRVVNTGSCDCFRDRKSIRAIDSVHNTMDGLPGYSIVIKLHLRWDHSICLQLLQKLTEFSIRTLRWQISWILRSYVTRESLNWIMFNLVNNFEVIEDVFDVCFQYRDWY